MEREQKSLMETETGTIKPPRKRLDKAAIIALIVLFALAVLATALIYFYAVRSATQFKNQPIVHESFDSYAWGWSVIGEPGGKISITKKPEYIKEGKGSLQFAYTSVPQKFIGIVTINAPLSGLQKIEFWMRSLFARKFIVGVDELDGSSYIYIFDLPAKEWTKVSAPADSFVLNLGSTDENGSLDADKLSTRLYICDVGGLAENGDTGDNAFWLDDLYIYREAAKKPPEVNLPEVGGKGR